MTYAHCMTACPKLLMIAFSADHPSIARAFNTTESKASLGAKHPLPLQPKPPATRAKFEPVKNGLGYSTVRTGVSATSKDDTSEFVQQEAEEIQRNDDEFNYRSYFGQLGPNWPLRAPVLPKPRAPDPDIPKDIISHTHSRKFPARTKVSGNPKATCRSIRLLYRINP